MAEIIKNSLIVRCIVLVYTRLREYFRYSLLGKAYKCLAESYSKSNTGRIRESLWGRMDPAEYSVYKKFLVFIEKILQCIGVWLENSLLYRALIWVKKTYFKLTAGSAIFGLINSMPLHRWFLVLFGMYLPLEYVIRDTLHLGFLASLWEELFILAGAALVIWRTCLKQTRAFSRATALETCLLLYMAVGLLLALINAPFPAIAIAGYRAQVEYVVWFFIILRLIDSWEDARALIWGFAGVVFLLSLHGIYQYIVAVPIPSSWVSQTEAGVRTRVFSLTGSPNIFGSLLVMAAPSFAALIYYCRDGWKKFLALAGVGIMCLCILFTFSRGAWVGLIVAILIFSVYIDKRLIGLMGMGMAAVLVAVPSITSRLTYLLTSDYKAASAVGGRALRWEVGRNLLHENNPWLGFGLGRFGGAVAMNNQVLDKTEEFSYFYMDNYYLKTLVEMGYSGFIVYILALAAFVILAVRAVYRCGRGKAYGLGDDALFRNEGSLKPIAAGLFAGMAGVLVHCYFENIFEEPYMMAYFWGLAAAVAWLGLYSKPEGGEKL